MSFTASKFNVEFDNVSLNINGRQILKSASFRLPNNKFSLLMGVSGAGKTSILRLVTGQIQPSSGRVLVNEQPIDYNNHDNLYHMRKNMGMVFQSSALFSDLTVAENVAIPLLEHSSMSAITIKEKVAQMLKTVNLLDAADYYAWQLSGGMQKRAAIARAGILNPQIMLYDEPLSGQDPITCQSLTSIMAARNTIEGNSAIVVSHKIEIIMPLVDYAVILKDGNIIFADHVLALPASSNNFIQDFVKNCNWSAIIKDKSYDH